MKRGAPGDVFRHLVGAFPSGVTVVTAPDDGEGYWGFTASSFISVSLEPPLVLVALDAKADCYAAFDAAEAFVVNILATGQKDVAVRFATRGIDKFAGLSTSPGKHTGGPIIDGVAAHVECVMHERHVAGDHVLLLGLVVGGEREDVEPLLYYHRAFGRFQTG